MERGNEKEEIGPQITPVPSPGATPVPSTGATGQAGQAQITLIEKVIKRFRSADYADYTD